MKTVTAQAWKLGTVGLAMMLAVTLLFSSSPSKVAEAAVGQATTCVIDITETPQQSMLNGPAAVVVNDGDHLNTSDTTLVVDGVTGTLAVGDYILFDPAGASKEIVLIAAVASQTSVTITRAQLGTTAYAIQNNTVGVVGLPAADTAIVLDGGGTTGMSVGTILTYERDGYSEDMTVTAIGSGTAATVTRGSNNSTATVLYDNTAIDFSMPTADNGPLTCVGTAGTDLNVTIKTSTPNVTAGIWLETEMIKSANAVNMGGNLSATATSVTMDSTTGFVAGDVITVGTEKMYVSSVTSGTVLAITRGYNGTTAAVHLDDAVVNLLSHNAKSFADANMIKPTLNGLVATSLDTKAERDMVALSTFTPATATAAAYYSTTVAVGTTTTTGGEAIIGICGPNSCPVYGADPDVSENLVHVLLRQAPIAYTDNNADGAYTAGTDTLRTSITAQSSVGTSATTGNAVFNVQDTKGQDLVGTASLTLSDEAFAAGIKWTNSGLQTISVTTTDTVGTPDETVGISGLPKTVNFRHTWDLSYSGTTGSITKTGGVIHRTNNKTASLTATLKKAGTAGTAATTDSTITAAIPVVAAGADDIYYVEVVALDSSGNKVNDTIKVKDNDGDGTDGLGSDITFEAFNASANEAAITSATTSSGKIQFAVRNAKAYSATPTTDPITGTYNLTFYRSLDATISADVTISVQSAAKTYTITATSGEVDGALPVGAVGTYTVTAVDANGNQISAAASPTFIVTGLGTGATAGKSIPTNGNLSVSPTLGGVISVVAPTVTGTGTIAVISSAGKIVASKALTFGSGAAAGSATVSGTGCTGTSTGSYTCVVTEGGTASEVATASGAVSVWQSDADGVLQGYVVGTPDFVDTGLASTAAIAANSAVIVVR